MDHCRKIAISPTIGESYQSRRTQSGKLLIACKRAIIFSQICRSCVMPWWRT